MNCIICMGEIKNPIQLCEYYDCNCQEKYYHLDCFVRNILQNTDKCPTCNKVKVNSHVDTYKNTEIIYVPVSLMQPNQPSQQSRYDLFHHSSVIMCFSMGMYIFLKQHCKL